MAAYKVQKFFNDNIPLPGVNERKIYWLANKHDHDATIITNIAQWLDQHYPPVGWEVSANSFRSNQPVPNDNTALEYHV